MSSIPVHDQVLQHITKNDTIPIRDQASLLDIARSSVYYTPVAPNPEDFLIMNRIDEIYTEQPYYGILPMTVQLHRDSFCVNHKRVARLMREMGLEAIYPKPNLSKRDNQHPTYPYLLKDLEITHPNHVWGTDITYIKLEQGFVYLTAYMDWYSRYVVSWQLSTTLSIGFVLECARRALSIGIPEIVNSDQGSHYTSDQYGTIWNPDTTRISMDHRGRCFDNIFTERLWRSVKYNDVYPNCYDTVLAVKEGLTSYFDIYNNKRLHKSLGHRTPAELYYS